MPLACLQYMASKLCALVVGIVYAFFGIAGLFPRAIYLPPPRLKYDQMDIVGHFGYLFTWLPTNPVHTALYILVGLGGIAAALTFFTATVYLRGVLLLTIGLTFMGLMPLGINHLFGLMPLFSWNVMLHAVTAMLVYYFGVIYPLDRGGPPPMPVRIRPDPIPSQAQ